MASQAWLLQQRRCVHRKTLIWQQRSNSPHRQIFPLYSSQIEGYSQDTMQYQSGGTVTADNDDPRGSVRAHTDTLTASPSLFISSARHSHNSLHLHNRSLSALISANVLQQNQSCSVSIYNNISTIDFNNFYTILELPFSTQALTLTVSGEDRNNGTQTITSFLTRTNEH